MPDQVECRSCRSARICSEFDHSLKGRCPFEDERCWRRETRRHTPPTGHPNRGPVVRCSSVVRVRTGRKSDTIRRFGRRRSRTLRKDGVTHRPTRPNDLPKTAPEHLSAGAAVTGTRPNPTPPLPNTKSAAQRPWSACPVPRPTTGPRATRDRFTGPAYPTVRSATVLWFLTLSPHHFVDPDRGEWRGAPLEQRIVAIDPQLFTDHDRRFRPAKWMPISAR